MSVKPITVNKEAAEQNKVMTILGYWIFIIALINMGKGEFEKYHANQSMLLVIFSVVLNIVVQILTMILPILGLLGFVVSLAILALAIIGSMNVNKLEAKPLPVIGELFTVIKY